MVVVLLVYPHKMHGIQTHPRVHLCSINHHMQTIPLSQECICTQFFVICKQYHTPKSASILNSPLYASSTTHPRVCSYSIHLYMQTIPHTQECIHNPFTFICKQYHTHKSAFVLHSPLYANSTIHTRVHLYSIHLNMQTIPHTQECIHTPFTIICKQYHTPKGVYLLHSSYEDMQTIPYT